MSQMLEMTLAKPFLDVNEEFMMMHHLPLVTEVFKGLPATQNDKL